MHRLCFLSIFVGRIKLLTFHIDIAYYFRHNPLTLAEAEARGLLPKTRAGEQTAASRIGLTVAANAGDNTFTLLVNGKCTAEDAYMACLIATTEEGQQLALETRAGKNGKKNSWEYVTALVRSAEQMQPADGGMLDLFGNDESFRESSEKLARYVAAVREGLKARISIFVNSSKLNRKADVAKELGVKVNTPEDATRLISRLANLDAAYERLDPDLGIPAKAEAWDGKSAVPTKLDELDANEYLRQQQTEATGMLSFSAESVYQKNIIADLRKDSLLDGFMKATDKVERSKKRSFSQDGIVFGELSDDDLAKLMVQNPGWPDEYDLKGAKHIIDENHIWHIYRGHCLDFFLKDDGLNLTYDDIRMLPDILKNYDSISPDFKDGRWGVVYIKNYGGIEYRYSAYISKPHRRSKASQNLHLVSGWITKKAVAGDGLTPQQPQASSASRFHRTATVTPMEEYIKQNYGEEAKKIARYAKDHGIVVVAPNGKITNLTPVQWLAVRLQSFKDWFGDWENDPANASKVVDENGEPLVVYHGTRSDFTVFDREKGGASNKYAYAGFWFSPIKGFGERFLLNTWWGDGAEKEMALFLNLRNPKVFETRKDEPYGDAYEHFRSDVVSLLGKDAEFANINGSGMAWYKRVNKMGIPDFMSTAEQKEVINEYRDKLKAEGYDGILIKQTEYDYSTAGSANDQYVAFEPNQIKSATDNRGTFDGSNPDITFSVVGEHAANWDKIKHRAFRGRDDGKLRVELDASRAKIKDFPKVYPVYDVMRKLVDAGAYASDEYMVYSSLKFIEDITDTEKGEKKLDETELKEDVNSTPDLAAEVEHGLKAAGLTWQSDIQAVRGACFTALSKWKKKLEEELKGLNIEKPSGEAWHALVEQKPGLTSVNSGKRIVSAWSGKWLDDVLDFPELFEAYPQLRNIQLAEDFGLALASASYSEFAARHGVNVGKNNGQYPLGFINMNPKDSTWSNERKATSILLHEIQHAIQDIEGFAKGANARNGMDAYMRSAGEIEARNVEKRMAWRAARREATPFNNTLEYPGETLVSFSIQSIMTDWSAALDNFVQNPPAAGSVEYRSDMYVCPTPAVMQMVGARAYDIVMSPSVMVKCLHKNTMLGNKKKLKEYYMGQKHEHDILLADMKQLPAALADPVCIIVSATPGCIEVITELKEGTHNILVAVQLDSVAYGTRTQRVNRIVSLYGKNGLTELLNRRRLYWNAAKARVWTGGGRLQLPTSPYPKRASGHKVLKPADLVKYKIEKSLSFALEPYTPAELAEGFLRRQSNGHRLLRRMAAYMRNQARRYRLLYPRMPKDTQAALQAIADAQALILYSLRLYIPYKFFKRRESVWQGHFLQSLNHGKQIPPAIFLFFSLPRQP